MLPLVARRPTQQIGRARFEQEGGAFPAAALFSPEPEPAGGAERNPDDIPEHRPVAVPADRRAGSVFGDERMFERRRGGPGEPRGAVAQRQQEGWKLRRLIHPAFGEVVMHPERDDAPLAEIALELELPE